MLTGAVTAAATVYTGLLNPNTSHAFPLCPLKLVTGLDCPFCGCLRSVHALTHGRIVEALNHNALFVASIPLLVAYWVGWLRADMGWSSSPTRPKIARPALIAAVAALTVFTIARNLPVAPFEWLNSAAS